jgi:hypothetical protein
MAIASDHYPALVVNQRVNGRCMKKPRIPGLFLWLAN